MKYPITLSWSFYGFSALVRIIWTELGKQQRHLCLCVMKIYRSVQLAILMIYFNNMME